ncbi:MAG: MaoC family dehydratase N-terminal domain-containing protein [Gammaproteobacteria bacterium]|nr:MaoC family dehydratase N-terminal domain-containing protein [Gammaproteobacteria bacterium]
MPIDRDQALAHVFPVWEGAYTRDDVILYHLGIGAGNPPTDPGELAYTYEKHLKVLPTFGVVAAAGAMGDLTTLPGMTYDRALILHGEQDIEVYRPLPPESRLRAELRIRDVFDKGKAALVVLETRVSDAAATPLWSSRMSLFVRGEGGFGGPRGPDVGHEPPERRPDGVIETRTLPQQALLYRLSGDRTPLHCDPEFARRGGFDRPIIHGLCSWGIACKAICDTVLDGDVTRIRRYEARFRGVAFPGETYVTEFWREGSRILLQARAKERDGAIILGNAAITLA